MIALTAGKSLEILLAGAVAAHQLEVVSSWTDVDPAASPQVIDPAGNDLVTADATPVTAVAAPAGTVARGVDHLSIFNADTAPATATARLNNGSAVRRLAQATLQPGETLTYSGRMGWITLDDQGAVKSTGQAVLLTGSPVVGGAANAVLREDAGQLLAADSGLTFAAGVITITVGSASTTLTQSGSQTIVNDPLGFQVQIASAPMLTINATQVQLGNSYLVVTTTGLTIATVPYVWPGANAVGDLHNDGSGGLTWTAPAAPTQITNAGGAVSVDGAGAVSILPLAGQAWTAGAGFSFNPVSGRLDLSTLKLVDAVGFFGKDPVGVPGPSMSTAGFSAGSGATVTADSSFSGGTGLHSYTIDDMVACLKTVGLIDS